MRSLRLPSLPRFCSLLAVLAMVLAAAARAQPTTDDIQNVRDAFLENFDPAGAGALYAASIDLTVNPDVSVSNLNLNSLEDTGLIDPNIQSFRLPFRVTFNETAAGHTPFLQVSLGYQDINMTIPFVEGRLEEVESDWRSFGAEVGAGLEVPISERWTLLPTANLGVADLSNDGNYRGPLSETLLRPALAGVIFDWDTRAFLAGASLGIRYEQEFTSFRLRTRASAAAKHIRSFDESSEFITIRDTVGTLDFELNTIHPVGTVGGTPWSLVSIFGASSFVGSTRGELGFDYFLEAGGAVQINLREDHWFGEQFRLGLKGFFGEDISGWSVVLGRGI